MLLKNSAARATAAAFILGGLAVSASPASAAEKTEGRVENRMEKSEVRIITVDDNEKMTVAGVKEPGRIEIRKQDGVKTVRIWDRKGKLITENAYGEADATPYDTITMTSADGVARTIDMTKSPEPPLPPTPPEPYDVGSQDGAQTFVFENDGPGGEKRAHKVVIKRIGGEQTQSADCRGGGDNAEIYEIETIEGKERRVEIFCFKNDGAGARADGLRAAIKQLEADGAIEAAHREKAIAWLKEELAKAEQEAAQAEKQ